MGLPVFQFCLYSLLVKTNWIGVPITIIIIIYLFTCLFFRFGLRTGFQNNAGSATLPV